jgi:phosphate uptake regulator
VTAVEGRKLQLAGKSTYLVSLPKRWVTTSGLKAGDTLFVEVETDGSVSVRPHLPEKVGPRRKIFTEDSGGTRDHLLRKLIGAYVSGFALIELRYPPDHAPFVRRVAREFCRLVIGPEVIDDGRTSLVIQDLSDPTELSSEKCLRRMHLTVRAMLEDAVSTLRTGDEGIVHDVEQRGQDVNRLFWMVAKQYHVVHAAPLPMADRANGSALQGNRLIAKLLERIADHAQRIARAAPALSQRNVLDAKLLKDIEEARTSAVTILDKAFSALVTCDIDAANAAVDMRTQHQKLIDGLSHRASPRRGEDLLALGTVVDSLGRAGGYACEIAEQAIDLSVLSEPGPA